MSRLELAAAGCFAVGVGLLFPFEATLTILFGLLFIGAAIVCGIFVLASPERLEREPDDSVEG